MLPVCISVIAGSWLMASVCSERIQQISSASLAVCGSRSLSHMPHWPCCWKAYLEGAIGKRAWPEVMVVRRWPLRIEWRQILVVEVLHPRLVVEEVHLRRAADHVQVDDVLGLAREVRPGRARAEHRRRLAGGQAARAAAHQGGPEGERAERPGAAREQLAPGGDEERRAGGGHGRGSVREWAGAVTCSGSRRD